MENFFYSDNFHSDLGELMDYLDYNEEEDVLKLPDDYTLNCIKAELEPIVTLSAEWIIDRIDEERLTEDGNEIERIEKALYANIDFEKLNSLMPKLYYEGIKKFTITKADMLEWIK